MVDLDKLTLHLTQLVCDDEFLNEYIRQHLESEFPKAYQERKASEESAELYSALEAELTLSVLARVASNIHYLK